MKRKFTLVTAAACFFILFLFIAQYTLININTLEDSIWLKPAIDISRGMVLFRDTFSPYGMVVPLLQGFTVKLFGPFLLPLRLEAAFFYAVTAVVMYFLWSRYMSKKLAAVSVFFWLVLAPFYDDMLLPWSSIYALVFQGVAFYFLTRYAEKHENRPILWSGVFIMLTILTRQPVGVFLACAAGGYLLFAWMTRSLPLRKVFSSSLYLFVGLSVTFLPFFIYLIFNKALHDWWIQSFIFAKEYAKVIRGISLEQLIKSLFLGRYYKMGELHLMLIWLAIPLSSLYLLLRPLVIFLKKRPVKQTDRMHFLAGLVCIGSWMQYYPMTEPTHFFWAVTPIVGFFACLTTILLPDKKKLRNLYMNLLWSLTIVLILMRVTVSLQRFRNVSVYSATMPFLKDIRISTFENGQIDTFYTTLSSHIPTGGTYINLSDDAMVPLIDRRFHQIPPLYEQWNFFAERLYPGYYDKVYSYILMSHPVIVTRTLPYVTNYCSLKHADYPQLYMGIHIPSFRVLDARLENSTLSLVPAKNITVTAVKELQTPIRSFSVRDLKKLKLVPVTYADYLLPVDLKKDEEIGIPLIKPASRLVIYFNDNDIDSCTLSVINSFKDK